MSQAKQAILIALGANLPSRAGSPRQTLEAALWELGRGGVHILRRSSFYRSQAWPDPEDPEFINAVAEVESALDPAALMHLLHETETSFGRTRSARNRPRTLDLDLLDYRGLTQTGPPILPHPRMSTRAFVLVPLLEIAPEWRHPQTGDTAAALIARLAPSDRESVRRGGESDSADY
jgi:2-amino-4-hydroxy-6-hydroxymethyldihydropteridine diphosphokinase